MTLLKFWNVREARFLERDARMALLGSGLGTTLPCAGVRQPVPMIEKSVKDVGLWRPWTSRNEISRALAPEMLLGCLCPAI